MHKFRSSPVPARRRIGVTVCTLVLSLVLAACASDAGSEPEANEPQPGDEAAVTVEATVAIIDFVYQPESVEVPAGTTVRWTNEDMFAHTVTSGEPGDPTDRFDGELGELDNVNAAGTTFEHAFTEPGTYSYFCRFHPKMRADVVVVP